MEKKNMRKVRGVRRMLCGRTLDVVKNLATVGPFSVYHSFQSWPQYILHAQEGSYVPIEKSLNTFLYLVRLIPFHLFHQLHWQFGKCDIVLATRQRNPTHPVCGTHRKYGGKGQRNVFLSSHHVTPMVQFLYTALVYLDGVPGGTETIFPICSTIDRGLRNTGV